MWLLALLPRVPWQAWAVVSFIGLAGLWHWHATKRAYEAGRAAAIEMIEAANREANRKASEGEAAVIGCHRLGRVWNRETGKCGE